MFLPQALACMSGSVLGAKETNVKKNKLLPVVPVPGGPVSLLRRLVSYSGRNAGCDGKEKGPSSAWGEGQVRGGTLQEESSAVQCREADTGEGSAALLEVPGAGGRVGGTSLFVIVGFRACLPTVDWELCKGQKTFPEESS